MARDAVSEKIAEHVVRVPLPLPLPDLKTVNAYAIVGSDGLTLIDPGWAYEPGEATLRAALCALGATPSDVRRILVTHQHWDHYSLAVRWRDELDAELMLGHEERHSIEAFAAMSGVHPLQVQMLVRAGAAPLAREVNNLDWEPYERGVKFTPPDRWLSDGDQIDCGGVTITARATPGHTRGHVVFDDQDHGAVFTGDHLLPRITPSIAFERRPERLPLRSYLASLLLFLDLPDSRMLAAHGPSDGRTRERAAELVAHHRTRLGLVGERVAAGATTAFEVASSMRWTRHDRALGDLDVMHRMTAVLEVLSHLELLVYEKALSSRQHDGIDMFSPA
ncbi:MBL fold metallo-hydrolase [Mycobacterium sp. 050134]|uniref:MBL fold metallo-hydrolase n=1 Tax=Mycobacterium sp. 050134 TaxID=3096111 RepID=UPI002ED88D41